ncbi:MAG TPA: hypothetical protein VGT03_00120 [Candidatus Acidoferrales bacterium]|nr:hypothetical protein [Candidatus Acidoferrales bacterium]
MATLLRHNMFVATVWLATALICMGVRGQAAAQENGAMIGQVTGDDISVAGPSQAALGENAQTIAFPAGSTIVVHSGKARVEFTGGGELDVCGPAKFVVLASGETITVALSFGRVHAKLDPSRPASIYTPLIIATPLSVANQPRDVTLGVAPTTGAMCVLATHGAVQVEQQLSGETLIVPQPREFSLIATPLGAAPTPAGSCQCDFDENSAKAAFPERIVAQNAIPVGLATIASADQPKTSQQAAISTVQTPPPSNEVPRKTDHPDLPLPLVPAAKPREPVPPPELPPTSSPITEIIAPPLLYEAKPLPAPAGTISVATVLLAKAVVVEPGWIIHGVVEEPAKSSGKSLAGGEKVPRKKKSGFWAWFHRFLFGSPPKST